MWCLYKKHLLVPRPGVQIYHQNLTKPNTQTFCYHYFSVQNNVLYRCFVHNHFGGLEEGAPSEACLSGFTFLRGSRAQKRMQKNAHEGREFDPGNVPQKSQKLLPNSSSLFLLFWAILRPFWETPPQEEAHLGERALLRPWLPVTSPKGLPFFIAEDVRRRR